MDAAAFALLVAQVIGVNLVLSADNAVVIALASRSLPRRSRAQAVVFGASAATALRITLTIAALELLKLPYLKLVGGALLLGIAVRLLVSDGDGDPAVRESATVGSAIAAILLADLVMSLDNVLAVAAAARGSIAALVLGLALSIPLVILGSTVLSKLMARWPVIVTIGAALIGWVAGGLVAGEPLVRDWVDANAPLLGWLAAPVCAIVVVVCGRALARPRDAPRT